MPIWTYTETLREHYAKQPSESAIKTRCFDTLLVSHALISQLDLRPKIQNLKIGHLQ